ncbi:MAG: ABC transporter ATP-binding protein, partial [Thiobacillus sp.]|nr:ABC transporter ATP-binding protein [Thiobacillus sp.]
FEGDGKLTEIVGGYADWRAWKQRQQRAASEKTPVAAPKPSASASGKPAAKNKLSYKEARELESLPGQIQTLEAEQLRIAMQLADPALYQSAAQDAAALSARGEAIEAEMLDALARWEALEAKAAS